MTYKEQINHPLWQKKRLEVLQAHNFACQECGATEETLNVHHTFYIKNTLIWEYDTKDLKCLCVKCHEEEHLVTDDIKSLLTEYTIKEKREVVGFLAAKLALKLYQIEQKPNAWFYLDHVDNLKGVFLVFPSTPLDKINIGGDTYVKDIVGAV